MGSVNASGISVVAKDPLSFRKRNVKITATDNTDDTVTTYCAFNDSLHRAIGSGSVVRDNNTVSYLEEIVTGAYMMGRSSDARIASDDATRVRVVELGNNQTDAVIPTGLALDTPQIGTVHAGERVITRNSVGDTLIAREENTGSYN